MVTATTSFKRRTFASLALRTSVSYIKKCDTGDLFWGNNQSEIACKAKFDACKS